MNTLAPVCDPNTQEAQTGGGIASLMSACAIYSKSLSQMRGGEFWGKKLRQHSDVNILYQNNLEETSTIFLSLGCQTQIGITD